MTVIVRGLSQLLFTYVLMNYIHITYILIHIFCNAYFV